MPDWREALSFCHYGKHNAVEFGWRREVASEFTICCNLLLRLNTCANRLLYAGLNWFEVAHREISHGEMANSKLV